MFVHFTVLEPGAKTAVTYVTRGAPNASRFSSASVGLTVL